MSKYKKKIYKYYNKTILNYMYKIGFVRFNDFQVLFTGTCVKDYLSYLMKKNVHFQI